MSKFEIHTCKLCHEYTTVSYRRFDISHVTHVTIPICLTCETIIDEFIDIILKMKQQEGKI